MKNASLCSLLLATSFTQIAFAADLAGNYRIMGSLKIDGDSSGPPKTVELGSNFSVPAGPGFSIVVFPITLEQEYAMYQLNRAESTIAQWDWRNGNGDLAMQLVTHGSSTDSTLVVAGAISANALYVDGRPVLVPTGNNSLVLGTSSVTGANSVAFGSTNTVLSGNSAAIGSDCYISANNAVALGYNSQAYAANSLAVGDGSYTAGANSISMGSVSAATGLTSLAIGSQAHALGDSAIALGVQAEASGWGSIAIGAATHATSNGSIAFGWNTTSNGNGSAALGVETIANADNQTVVGMWNEPQGTNGVKLPTDSLFIIGNGTSAASGDRSNAMVVRKDGAMGVGERIQVSVPAQTVVGKYNNSAGTHGNGLFIVGNGTSTDRKNALRVREDGTLLTRPAGDVDMGLFTAGEQP